MLFHSTSLEGLFVVELEMAEDSRGYFARTFCAEEFAQHGLCTEFPQCNVSFNTLRGTLRGMHTHLPPYEEAKLVRCTRGEIFDVVVDVRPNSSTFGKYFTRHLSAQNGLMLFIPKGFAHGFQTLTDTTEVFYQMSDAYVAGVSRGFRYDDADIGIPWPQSPTVISEADTKLPSFQSVSWKSQLHKDEE